MAASPSETDDQAARRREAEQLAYLGAAIQDQDTRVRVQIPRALAERAIRAWNRDDEQPLSEPEPEAERLARHRAGSLALIGLALTERGQELSDSYSVDLDAWLIGHSLDAADDLDLIVGGIEPRTPPH